MLMDSLLSNAVLATVLAATALLVARIWRRPPLAYWLWLLVLVKLITPGMLPLPHVALFQSESSGTTDTASLVPISLEKLAADVASTPANTNATIDIPRELSSIHTVDQPALEPAVIEQPAPLDNHATSATGEVTALSARPIPWRPAIASVWIAGSLLWIVVAIVRIWKFDRLVALAAPAPDWLQLEAQRISDRYGLSRLPSIRSVRAQVPPLVWAIFARPVVLLPSQLIDELSRGQLVALLAHELAHVRRGDHWVRRLEMIVLAVYWWHPVAWLARRQLQEAEELCCDAWVTWNRPDAARSYADAIVQTVEFLSAAHSPSPIAASRITPVRLLERRIQMILTGRSQRRLSWMSGVAVLALGLAALPWSTRTENAVAAAPQTQSSNSAPRETAVQSDAELLDTLMNASPQAEPVVPTVATQARNEVQPVRERHAVTDSAFRADSADTGQPSATDRSPQRRRIAAQQSDMSRDPLVARPAAPQAANIKVFSLNNADADSMSQLLHSLFGDGLRIAADRRTNSVIAIAMPDQLMMIEAIIFQLDKAESHPPKDLKMAKDAAPDRYREAEAVQMKRGLQIHKLPDQQDDVLIVRGAGGKQVDPAEVAKILKDGPAAKGATFNIPVPGPEFDKLQMVIRQQQHEIQELRTAMEQLKQHAQQLEMQGSLKEELRKLEAAQNKVK